MPSFSIGESTEDLTPILAEVLAEGKGALVREGPKEA